MRRAQRNASNSWRTGMMGFASLYRSYETTSAQRSRMHPPAGMIAPELLRRAAGFGGVLVDRKTSGARSGHPRQPRTIGRVERPDDLADHGLNAQRRRFEVVGAGSERLDPVFERRRSLGPAVL